MPTRRLSTIGLFAVALAMAQNPEANSPIPRNAPPAVVRKTMQTTGGQTLEGQVLSEGMLDLALRTSDKRIVLLRKQGIGTGWSLRRRTGPLTTATPAGTAIQR